MVQLPTNYRCPSRIVEAANRLVVYNARRDESKRPARAAQRSRSLDNQQIRCRVFETDADEVAGIASEIACLDVAARGETLVLGRTWALLGSMGEALQAEHVPATNLMRRDDFVSDLRLDQRRSTDFFRSWSYAPRNPFRHRERSPSRPFTAPRAGSSTPST